MTHSQSKQPATQLSLASSVYCTASFMFPWEDVVFGLKMLCDILLASDVKLFLTFFLVPKHAAEAANVAL